MTYLDFLGLFIAPVLLVTAVLAYRAFYVGGIDRTVRRTGVVILGLLLVAAWFWTTPWDSWIIRQGVWSYPGGRVVSTLFRVPAEEYLFMAGQTAAVGMWTLWNIAHHTMSPGAMPQRRNRLTRYGPAATWAIAAAAGLAMIQAGRHGTYLGSMLLWFGPLLAVQSLVGADLLHSQRIVRAGSLLPALVYLCAADRIAIAARVWHISADRTYGLKLLGLPAEEALFFAITSLLVVNGLILAVHPLAQHRLRQALPTRSGRKSVMT